MQRREAQSIGDILRLTIQECNMTARLDERKAVDAWPLVVGPIAQRCGRPVVKDGVMSIAVPSAAMRQELHMSRSSLIKFINSHIGKPVITEIRFTS